MNRISSKICRDSRSNVKESPFPSGRSISSDNRGRISYGQDSKRSSSVERKTSNVYNRWSGGARRSSILSGSEKRIIKDTRQLNDKNYQKQKVQELVEFLDKYGFNYPISAAKLNPPSKKDYENIFQFLYSYFDPKYQVKKLEEEAPQKLKALGYPFTVNKSAFVYVARTNWSSLLGVLIFLMDLCKFTIKLDPNVVIKSEDDKDIISVLLPYLVDVYHSQTENEEKDDEIFHQIIELKLLPDKSAVECENQEKEQLLKTAERELEERKELVSRLEKVESDSEKYKEFIAQMEVHYNKKKEEFKNTNKILQEKKRELKELRDEVSKKQEIFEAQGFDGKKHLQYIDSQKKELAEKLEKKSSAVRERKDLKEDLEIQYIQTRDKITSDLEQVKELYTSYIEKVKASVSFLSTLDLPEAQKLYDYFYNDFPELDILTDNSYSPQKAKEFEAAIEKIYEKIGAINRSLISVAAALSAKINEIELRKSELYSRLKLLSAKESKREEILLSKEKEGAVEISELRVKCESLLVTLEELRSKRLEKETIVKETLEDITALQNYKIEKDNEVEEYIRKQKKLIDYCQISQQRAADLTEEYGQEIVQTLKELKK